MARVLIVEDHPANLKLARLILESAGHEVLGAEAAAEGMELAAGRKPQVIFMDIQMPGIDGLEATRRLKRAHETAAIPIVALTASAMPGDEARIREAGCDDYLTKPFRRAELLAMVARWTAPS
jgi:two-component system cell cycle response regulator DivK